MTSITYEKILQLSFYYGIIKRMVDKLHFVFLTDFDDKVKDTITSALGKCKLKRVEKKIKAIHKHIHGIKILVITDDLKEIQVFFNGKLDTIFRPYMVYYPKNVTLYGSDTGEDIMVLNTTDVTIDNFISNEEYDKNYKSTNVCHFSGKGSRKRFNKMLFPHTGFLSTIEDVIRLVDESV